MGTRKIVPLRPRQKEGRQVTPKPLTLADIVITWTEGMATWETRHYVTGESLARLVLYLRHRHPNTLGHDPLNGDVGPIPSYLRGLSYIVFPDAGAPSEDREKDVRYTLSEYLDDLAARMQAADSAEPATYAVHVGRSPRSGRNEPAGGAAGEAGAARECPPVVRRGAHQRDLHRLP